MPDRLDDWLTRLEQRHFRSIDLGLDRCGQVYRRLGSPRPAETVFSVAGTNGKGSVTAYLAAITAAAGLRCGTYTSPHILEFNERIGIKGRLASDHELVHAFGLVEAARGDVSLTYFEFTTLAAFHLMHEAGLDVAVLEVGLGGRLDAVNLVDTDCAVITPIGLDHQEYLGDDIESIGREKAGIMRPGKPVVTGDRTPPRSIVSHARRLGADLHVLGESFDVAPCPDGLGVTIDGRRHLVGFPPLAGTHQAENLAVALAALDRVFPGLLDRADAVSRGIADARLAGRLQRLEADRRLLLDVGHNPLAASVVADFLAGAASGRCLCVLGMYADKDVEGVAGELAPQVDDWLCAGLAGPRGQDGAMLARRVARRVKDSQARAFDTIAEALAAARGEAAAEDTILVFGSFETVGAALRCMAYTASQC